MVRGSHAGGGFPKSEIFQAKRCTIAMAGEQERQEPGETGASDGGAGCEAGAVGVRPSPCGRPLIQVRQQPRLAKPVSIPASLGCHSIHRNPTSGYLLNTRAHSKRAWRVAPA